MLGALPAQLRPDQAPPEYLVLRSVTLTAEQQQFLKGLCDRMVEVVLDDFAKADVLFKRTEPAPFKSVNVLAEGRRALEVANTIWIFRFSQSAQIPGPQHGRISVRKRNRNV